MLWGSRYRTVKLKLICMVGVSATLFSCVYPTALAESSAQVRAPLTGKTIVVDAGHGGPDGGARGVTNVEEKTITLPVSIALVKLLQEAGAHVVCTRVEDDDLASDEDRLNKRRHSTDLLNRFLVVRKQPIDAFVSIHCNAAPSAAWRGAQVIYLKNHESSKMLAEELQSQYRALLLPTTRSIQANSTLYLLKRITQPAVLAEVGFVTNPEEMSAMETKAYQHRIAFATYLAILHYFETPLSDASPSQGGKGHA